MTSWTKKSLLTEAAKGSVVTIVVTEPRKSLVKSEKVLDMAEAVRFELTEDSHPRRFSRPVP